MSLNELIAKPNLRPSKPGDEAKLRITKTNREVITVKLDNGTQKYSRTQYPNGTVHETKTSKPC